MSEPTPPEAADVESMGRYCVGCRRIFDTLDEDGACVRCTVNGYVPPKRRQREAAIDVVEAAKAFVNGIAGGPGITLPSGVDRYKVLEAAIARYDAAIADAIGFRA